MIGSQNSSNSNRLVETARAAGVEAHLIEDETAIDERWLERREDGRADLGRIGARSGSSRASATGSARAASTTYARARRRRRGRLLPPAARSPRCPRLDGRLRRLPRLPHLVPHRGEPRPARCRSSACTAARARSSAYFHPLEQLTGRQVVVYDQLGCGDSDRPDDARFGRSSCSSRRGRRGARAARPRPRSTCSGTSWGGMLAQEYALDPARRGLSRSILSSTLVERRQWVSETTRGCSRQLGPDATTELRRPRTSAGSTHRRRSWRHGSEAEPEVYEAMWGPNEWTCTGLLAGWDVRDRLGEIGCRRW